MSFNNKPFVVGIPNQFQFLLIRRVGFVQLDLNGCGIEAVSDSNNLLLLGDHEHERMFGKRPSAGAILIKEIRLWVGHTKNDFTYGVVFRDQFHYLEKMLADSRFHISFEEGVPLTMYEEFLNGSNSFPRKGAVSVSFA
jgi:hypothetical protein